MFRSVPVCEGHTQTNQNQVVELSARTESSPHKRLMRGMDFQMLQELNTKNASKPSADVF